MVASSEGAGRGRKKKIRPTPIAPIPEERQTFQRTLGSRVKDRRMAQGWTPKDLAARSGITDMAIRNIETGKGSVQVWTLYCLAKALGVPAGWLAFGG